MRTETVAAQVRLRYLAWHCLRPGRCHPDPVPDSDIQPLSQATKPCATPPDRREGGDERCRGPIHSRGQQLLRQGLRCLLGLLCALLLAHTAFAAGGPLGIDHRLRYDDSGIWSRHTQLYMLDVLILQDLAVGAWEGGETRLGQTYWSSIDSLVLGGVASTTLKVAFSRERPGQVNDPNRWFTGHGNQSFPSGEVTATAAIVTPFVLEYGRDQPLVWALELLPAYDAEARMKT
jgi:hypothetical protein